MKTPALILASILMLVALQGADAQVDPKPIAIEFDKTVLRPMQLEAGDALAALKQLVEQGFACRLTAPGKAYPGFPTPPVPAGVACERKLGDVFDGYPRLMVGLSTPGQAGDTAARWAQLADAPVRLPHAYAWVPYRAVKDAGVAEQADQELQAWVGRLQPLQGHAAAATQRALAAGLACGVQVADQFGEPLRLACVLAWPTRTCRAARLLVSMQPGADRHLARPADLLWSEAHEVAASRWTCLDPTTPDRRGDDARSALFGWRW